MKSLLRAIYIVVITVLMLHSCNSDVFISDFTPSVSEVRISEKDSVSDVYFEASNWDILSVFFTDKYNSYNEIRGDIYGHDGNLIAGNSYLYTNGAERVKMTISHPDIKLTIERKEAKHLVLSNPENMDYETKRIYITIGNTYSRKQISVDIEPSTRYNLDSIVYSESYLIRDSIIMELDGIHYINSTDKVATFDIYPYNNFSINYYFVNNHELEEVLTEEQLKIFGKDAPVVPVPVINQYGYPTMSNVTLPLSAGVHKFPLPDEMLNLKETVNVNPLKQKTCTIKCWKKYYGLWLTIYASHPITGEKRILKGLLDIYAPQSFKIEYGEETDLKTGE